MRILKHDAKVLHLEAPSSFQTVGDTVLLAGLVIIADAIWTGAIFHGGLAVAAGTALAAFGAACTVMAPRTTVLISKPRRHVTLERSGFGFRLLEPVLRLARREERSLEQFEAVQIESVTDSDGGLTHRLGLAFAASGMMWLEPAPDERRLEREITSGLIADFLGVGLDGIRHVERRE